MHRQAGSNRRPYLGLAAVALAALVSGCGGGGGESATVPLSTTVIDGPLENALVCLDKNANGACDAGEPQGRTNAAGKVTFEVARADVGRYAVLAMVGTDARDENGPVTSAYSLSTPADKTAVVSPLTTLVHHVARTNGVSSDDAAIVVQNATGLSVSVFTDYSSSAAPTDGSVDPATLARMLVVTTQQQYAAVSSAVGTAAVDNSTISRADVDLAIRKKLLERMPAMLTALANPAVAAATTPQARESAIQAAATTLVADSGLSSTTLPTLVAVNNQISNPAPVAAYVPTAGVGVADLTFTDANNYFMRAFTSSQAQDTPDSDNYVRFQNRRYQKVAGFESRWAGASGGAPARQADLHWNGSAWVSCGLNFESKSRVRDAQGRSDYIYCDNRETGTSQRAVIDIAGQTMLSVYNALRAAGHTNLTITDPATALGSAVFPPGSTMRYQSGTVLTTSVTYYPAGKDNPPGQSNTVAKYSSAITAGGDGRTQPQGQGCNANEGNGTPATTLEEVIASGTGNPCIFTPGDSFTYLGQLYTNPDPTNEWWGGATLSIGTIGTAPFGSGPAPGYFSGNTRLRVAFKGSGTNPVTYYACKERFNNGSTRNCTAIGTGSYTIATLGDARVMTFNNLPSQAAALTFDRAFVQRGGAVYFGFKVKLGTNERARPNSVASVALLSQLGIPAVDPSAPLTLTAGSYQGVYDLREAGSSVPALPAFVLTYRSDGSASCQEGTAPSFSCTVSITDPATGAFTASFGTSTVVGTVGMFTGMVTAVETDPANTPPTTNVIGFRR